MWQRSTQACEVMNLPTMLSEYRTHDSQSSARLQHQNDEKLKRIRTERLRYFFPNASEAHADIHHLLCNLTYWSADASIVQACHFATELSTVVTKKFPEIAKPLRRLLREKLLALTYSNERSLSAKERLLLSEALIKSPLFIGCGQLCLDLLGYRLARKQLRATPNA